MELKAKHWVLLDNSTKTNQSAVVVCFFDTTLLMIGFLIGMHYLHAEAPVKVIHRDLKSRNGNT